MHPSKTSQNVFDPGHRIDRRPRRSAARIVRLYVGAWFVELSCRLFGGQADSREVVRRWPGPSVPLLATIPIWMIQLAVLGKEVFTSRGLVSVSRDDLPSLGPDSIWFLGDQP